MALRASKLGLRQIWAQKGDGSQRRIRPDTGKNSKWQDAKNTKKNFLNVSEQIYKKKNRTMRCFVEKSMSSKD